MITRYLIQIGSRTLIAYGNANEAMDKILALLRRENADYVFPPMCDNGANVFGGRLRPAGWYDPLTNTFVGTPDAPSRATGRDAPN